MICKYMYYNEGDKYFPKLHCSTDNKNCIYQKRCNKVQKFIPIENLNEKECVKYIMEEQKNIPKGSYFVQTSRKNKKGNLYLYVVIGDRVERISTNLKEINQNYVYIKEELDGYKVSLTPIPTEKKTYQKKQTNKTPQNNKKSYE